MNVWKGVRFAESPTGEHRLAPPRPVERWAGVRDATEFGPAGLQPTGAFPGPQPPGMRQSEDCLFLNVWSPSTFGKRPVIVWIHGGAFVMGAGSHYDGSVYAARGDTVLVTINYRLGAFGGLALPDRPGVANLRLLDQIEALRWVRRNIGAFGGDAGNVTVMGESAGGMSIGALLGAPAAKGLFRRAIVQSGGPRPVRDHAYARRITEAMMRALELDAPEQMMQVPAQDLLAASMTVHEAPASLEPFAHVTDGFVLPTHPLDHIDGEVDLLIGTCAKEADLFMPTPLGVKLERGAKAALGSAWDRIFAVYRDTALPRQQAVHDLISGWFAVMPSVWLAEAAHLAGGRVWQYTFDYTDASPAGACHGSDVPFTFGTVEPERLAPNADPVEAQSLSHSMLDAFVAFARTGNPSHPDLPAWPRFRPDRRANMSFGATSRVVDDRLSRVRRQAWAGIDPHRVC
ncbi:para-nitrobenzyl esterase [Streptomyces zagrosensis]|uniref:Carboxylic ester hydrolase n=1 Tax=Streptomyces zagrosensis TaxID=1042984 RepID=A0A7W9QE32_9ACTN|nr:para-nitrobenzyl esterase [Streptomyces zagrosensis]